MFGRSAAEWAGFATWDTDFVSLFACWVEVTDPSLLNRDAAVSVFDFNFLERAGFFVHWYVVHVHQFTRSLVAIAHWDKIRVVTA